MSERISQAEVDGWSAEPRGMGFYVGAGEGYGPLTPHFEK